LPAIADTTPRAVTSFMIIVYQDARHTALSDFPNIPTIPTPVHGRFG